VLVFALGFVLAFAPAFATAFRLGFVLGFALACAVALALALTAALVLALTAALVLAFAAALALAFALATVDRVPGSATFAAVLPLPAAQPVAPITRSRPNDAIPAVSRLCLRGHHPGGWLICLLRFVVTDD
jgi:hypothetical protein